MTVAHAFRRLRDRRTRDFLAFATVLELEDVIALVKRGERGDDDALAEAQRLCTEFRRRADCDEMPDLNKPRRLSDAARAMLARQAAERPAARLPVTPPSAPVEDHVAPLPSNVVPLLPRDGRSGDGLTGREWHSQRSRSNWPSIQDLEF